MFPKMFSARVGNILIAFVSLSIVTGVLVAGIQYLDGTRGLLGSAIAFVAAFAPLGPIYVINLMTVRTKA